MIRTDIEKITLENENYRKVLRTNKHQQLVVMCLKPGEDIPAEVHHGSQFIRIESGRGRASSWNRSGKSTDSVLRDGVSLLIPAGTRHYVRNTSKTKSLKLYAIYSPPEHRSNARNKRQPELQRHD